MEFYVKWSNISDKQECIDTADLAFDLVNEIVQEVI